MEEGKDAADHRAGFHAIVLHGRGHLEEIGDQVLVTQLHTLRNPCSSRRKRQHSNILVRVDFNLRRNVIFSEKRLEPSLGIGEVNNPFSRNPLRLRSFHACGAQQICGEQHLCIRRPQLLFSILSSRQGA